MIATPAGIAVDTPRTQPLEEAVKPLACSGFRTLKGTNSQPLEEAESPRMPPPAEFAAGTARRTFAAMRAALVFALSLAACGPLTPLPPQGAPDTGAARVDAAADTDAPDGPALDASVCTYPLRVGCVGSAGCMGYRECDFTETFLGPCTCYPDAGWDRPPAVDAPPADAPGVVDAAAPEDRPPPDVVTADDRPALADVADAGARDSGLTPSVCVAHMIGCSSNRECEACGATPEGVSFCCSTNTNVCLLRNVTRGCMR